MLLLALRGEPSDRAILLKALQDRKRRLAALWALGFLGTPEAVDASHEWLEDRAAGPLAGEVFTAVTGVDLEEAEMSVAADDADEALEHRPEDDLPRPNPMAVLQWWIKHRGRFVDGERYVGGEPLSQETLKQVLMHGAMRRRGPICRGLRLRATGDSSRYPIQTLAPTRFQKRQLAAVFS